MIRTLRLYLELFGIRKALAAASARLQGKQIQLPVRSGLPGSGTFLRLPSSDVLTYREVFTRQEYQASFRKQPEFIIDAGANVGVTSVFFTLAFPDAIIAAIEPESDNFRQLQLNSKDYPNIRPIHAALWHRTELLAVKDEGLGEWGFQTRPNHDFPLKGSSDAQSVGSVTVEEILTRFGRERIDLLKIDIEGAERELLMASQSWIPRVQVMVTELHERFSPGALRAFFNATNDFPHEWIVGDTIWVARDGTLLAPPGRLR